MASWLPGWFNIARALLEIYLWHGPYTLIKGMYKCFRNTYANRTI